MKHHIPTSRYVGAEAGQGAAAAGPSGPAAAAAAPGQWPADIGHRPAADGQQPAADGQPPRSGAETWRAAGPAVPAPWQRPGADQEEPGLLLLDADGCVLAGTTGADALLGIGSGQSLGRRIDELFCEEGLWTDLAEAASAPQPGRPATACRGGAALHLQCAVLPAEDTPAAAARRFALYLVSAAAAQRCQDEQALIRALFGQSHIGLAIHDQDLKVTRANTGAGLGHALPKGIGDFLVPEDAAVIEAALRRAADGGMPLVDAPHRARRLDSPGIDRTVSLSALPLRDPDGGVRGIAAAFTDITEQYRARQRRSLLNAAAKRIGASLEVTHCAEEVAKLLVPDLADLVAVDLTEVVLVGEEPGDILRGAPLRRVATASSNGDWPAGLYPKGATIRLRGIEAEHLRKFSATVPDWAEMSAAFADDEDRSRLLLPEQADSFMVVPLHARGLVLGALMLWRTHGRPPFDQQDAELAEEIVSRAALGVDNARRYTRERRTAEALRRTLLPPAVVEVSAAEAAGTCLPAATTEGIGGTWFDVIPLSSARVAFVVGDSTGHGLEATAATGRLRTAVRTLADLDLAPEELLSHLDDLVVRLSETDVAHGAPPAGQSQAADTTRGSTCLYAVYDPVTGHCTMASAGHPPPAVIAADGTARLVDCEPGAPLGVSGPPIEPVDLMLEPGSLLACYSGKLLAHIGAATDHLCDYLQAAAGQYTPAEIGRRALDGLVPEPPADDITLLVARLRGLPRDATASWDFPPDPAMVTQARQAVTAQLDAWGLEDLTHTTELVASELVTNAIRYAGGPVRLRLIRDEALVCEVSDPTQTQPHLRRARLTDEGGRGLFLIHQLTHRWGSRYTASGKTIWTEQALPGPAPADS